ncbi:hypothetical protein Ddye_030779 [Dipteronia dyeriana]|uniref:Uncharacterized protein n=1 Tax=Dipteronia dyeriana TaxID=168575 RepID=A0AAD9WMV4_9ROSI|nr:hypothetical protein Ddye_030779 [Dipteronia dyeriana]
MQNLLIWRAIIMELLLVITVLCFSFSLFQSPCVSLDIQVQPLLQNGQLYVSTVQLPRKLRFTAEVTVNGDGETLLSHNKHREEEEVAPGKEEKVSHGNGSKGTWQEWVEGTDTSQYFTMDYSHVKRRRPIHNKSLPVAP